eukprot:jgi/Picsp_1/5406/NSC_02766-R1_---NA---
MKAAKPKRRIVPQQISSPTGISKHKVDALSGNFKIGDLREQERLGKELLGDGRKVYITLVPFQKEQKQVNWKKILREQGVQNGHGSGEKPDSVKPFTAYLKAITRSMKMSDDEDEDSDDDIGPGMNDGGLSGSDEDGRQDLEDDGERNGDEDVDATGAETNLEDEVPPAPKRRKKDSYDYMDDFIDDSEFIEMVEHTDKRKSKHKGFVIYRGTIQRDTEVGAPEMDKPEDGPKRGKKKKTKETDQDSKAKNAPKPGQKQAELTPKKRRGKLDYKIPDGVKFAIDNVRKVAEACEDPGVPVDDDGVPIKRRSLPQTIRMELIQNDQVFKKESDKYGPAAQNVILDALMVFLHPYTARENLRAYIMGRMGGKNKDEIVFNPSKLRAIVAGLKPPKPVATTGDANANGEVPAGDAYVANIEQAGQDMKKKIHKQIEAGLKGESLESEQGQKVLSEVEACFPTGTISVEALKILGDTHTMDATRRSSLGEAKPMLDLTSPNKEEINKGTKYVIEMEPNVSQLSLEEILSHSTGHGAQDADVRGLLESERIKNDEFLSALYKILAVAGPKGLKIKFIADYSQRVGLVRSTISVATATTSISKLVRTSDDIVPIKGAYSYYALKCMPGVVAAPKRYRSQEETAD